MLVAMRSGRQDARAARPTTTSPSSTSRAASRCVPASKACFPPGTPERAVVATIRQMRRRWLELYGDDPFFAED